MAKQILHYPRLDTILKVEEVLRKADDAISKNELDRRLDKKIMRPTLNLILEYLQKSNKIAILKEGILWIWYEDSSPEFKKMYEESIAWDGNDPEKRQQL